MDRILASFWHICHIFTGHPHYNHRVVEQKKETDKRKEGGLDRSAEPVEMSIGSKIVKVSDIPFCKETALAFT